MGSVMNSGGKQVWTVVESITRSSHDYYAVVLVAPSL